MERSLIGILGATSREEGTVGVRCTRSKSAVFTGFAAGIHEIS